MGVDTAGSLVEHAVNVVEASSGPGSTSEE